MNRSIFLLAIIFLLLSLSSITWASPKHIHLTWQDDPKYSIVVSWRTDSQEPSWVQYGTELPYSKNATGPSGELHHVHLVDLQPGKIYYYRCGSGQEWSDDLTFETAPLGPLEPFKFVALGDSRTNWEIWGDCSEATLAVNPDFVLHTGDLVAHGGDQAEWDIWFNEATDLLREVVFMPAVGNHEDNAPNYYQQFALPHNEDWYSFDYGNAHFISLSTEKPMTGTQRAWLEQDLASTDATWIFAFYHRPMYSSGSHGPERPVYHAWGDLFDKYHVDMVFNGHDHMYERSHPMADDWIADSPENGTIHIVTGGAGAPLYGMAAKGPWSASFNSVNHIVLLEINGTELQLEAMYLNQTVFDELKISKAVLPDLLVQSVSTSPKYPIPGVTATVEIELANSGKAGSSPFEIIVKVDDEVLGELDAEAMGPGDVQIMSLDWIPSGEGYHEIEITVDPDNQVYENLGESNNLKEYCSLASVPKPDLVTGKIESSEIIPEIGDIVTYDVEVINEGTSESGPFDVDVEIGDGEGFILATVFNQTSGLQPGESVTLPVQCTCSPGNWELMVELDSGGEVEEISEENNLVSRKYYYRDFLQVGPAYLPQGFRSDETVLIYYDQNGGEIPSNSTCVLVWGINGWRKPPADMAPPGTVERNPFETPMHEVSEGLWMVAIPTDERFEWIDLKFEDRQFLPKYLDDNGGDGWIIPGENWAYGKIDDLRTAMEEAEYSGVDISPYLQVLEDVNTSLGKGQYLDAAMALINATDNCRLTECELLLSSATSAFQDAVEDGLDVSRVENFLVAAQSQLDSGNYAGSKQFSLTSLRFISEAREAVPQSNLLLLLVASLLLLSRGKACANREH